MADTPPTPAQIEAFAAAFVDSIGGAIDAHVAAVTAGRQPPAVALLRIAPMAQGEIPRTSSLAD